MFKPALTGRVQIYHARNLQKISDRIFEKNARQTLAADFLKKSASENGQDKVIWVSGGTPFSDQRAFLDALPKRRTEGLGLYPRL